MMSIMLVFSTFRRPDTDDGVIHSMVPSTVKQYSVYDNNNTSLFIKRFIHGSKALNKKYWDCKKIKEYKI